MSDVRSSMEEAQTRIAVRREVRGAAILVVLMIVPIAAFAVLIAAFTGGSADSGDTDAASSSQTVAAGGDAAEGETIFAATCAACHGADAQGVAGLGLPLAGSEFVVAASDTDLVGLIDAGRAADAADNTTGVAMPPKGGDASLTEEQVGAVAAYIKSLNE